MWAQQGNNIFISFSRHLLKGVFTSGNVPATSLQRVFTSGNVPATSIQRVFTSGNVLAISTESIYFR